MLLKYLQSSASLGFNFINFLGNYPCDFFTQLYTSLDSVPIIHKSWLSTKSAIAVLSLKNSGTKQIDKSKYLVCNLLVNPGSTVDLIATIPLYCSSDKASTTLSTITVSHPPSSFDGVGTDM